MYLKCKRYGQIQESVVINWIITKITLRVYVKCRCYRQLQEPDVSYWNYH